MDVRGYQRLRLPELRNRSFRSSAYADEVTLLTYTFPSDVENDAFDWIEYAILQSWAVLGRLHTVIVAHKHFLKLDRFADTHAGVEVQIESALIPGRIHTMSIDCIRNLWKRFETPYVLIVQDDGFPLVDTLSDFLGKWDFIGAPVVRNRWYTRLVANLIGFRQMNGGFSLRSKVCCTEVARHWETKYSGLGECHATVEDVFYTNYLVRKERGYRRKMRFPDIVTAAAFSYQFMVPEHLQRGSLGFHQLNSFKALYESGLVV